VRETLNSSLDNLFQVILFLVLAVIGGITYQVLNATSVVVSLLKYCSFVWGIFVPI
jgi:hypothetical protein